MSALEYLEANLLTGSPDNVATLYNTKLQAGEVFEGVPTIIGEDGPEVFVPETDGNIISNPKTAGGYTWEDAIIDSSEMLKKIKQSSGAEEAKKALEEAGATVELK